MESRQNDTLAPEYIRTHTVKIGDEILLVGLKEDQFQQIGATCGQNGIVINETQLKPEEIDRLEKRGIEIPRNSRSFTLGHTAGSEKPLWKLFGVNSED